MQRLQIIVSGRVQGVFFRANTVEQAQRLGLAGYVRNLHDGNVEIVAEGRREALEELLAWSFKGPPGAKVTDLEYAWLEPSGEFRIFEQRW